MKEEELIRLIEEWDDIQAAADAEIGEPSSPEEMRTRKEKESPHDRMKRDLWFLIEQFYSDYERNEKTPFKTIFLQWLGQFNGALSRIDEQSNPDLALEQRYAFILAGKLMYITRRQMLVLIGKVWNGILDELFRQQCCLKCISPIQNMKNENLLEEAISQSLIMPLSDSGRLMEFRQETSWPTSNVLDSIKLLLDPSTDPGNLAAQKRKYADKTSAFIIEDFSGSGTTAKGRIKKIINNYDFQNIYFCPYVIFKSAADSLAELIRYASNWVPNTLS